MITNDTFKNLLTHLGFEGANEVFTKQFDGNEAYLKVDFKKGQLIYPEDKGLIVNERQTCNLSANENFVVFECVHRLLEKGYKPEHLELEPAWKLGHTGKSGRADIMVRNQQGFPILIIECKTAGKEFEKAWDDTKTDGGQLFSYLQQQNEVEFLCLYASNFGKNGISRKAHLITVKDNQTQIELDKDKEIKRLFYKDAKNVKQLFKVWKETYKYDYHEIGIFEDNIEAYNIGKEKLNLSDLKYIEGQEMQSKFHEFAEVLRRYSVSNKEAAFDKLINLFLCKIVDETQSHKNGKALDFYWRGEYADSYFELIDRLQKLYKEGMETFLGETITYIDTQRVIDSFSYFIHDENATKEHVLDLFKQQKYYTNSDFSFIDVHNPKLFEQNARILLDIVKMWQYYQLNGEQENQFLSDMFEFFLAKGFKQDEGQFFTPIPICRFILHSLPVKHLLETLPKPPKVLDYACGAGHFLTEYASLAKYYIQKNNAAIDLANTAKTTDTATEAVFIPKKLNIKDYYKNVFGVEKEYRLSKVAKISAFMYGQDEINVIYCDALDKMHQMIGGKGIGVIEDEVDIIVANPPFAVEGFLKNLPNEVRQNYSLLSTVSDEEKNRNIQCFFIERTYQMLKPGGVTGVIVPSSVLSNSDSTHIATRELILQHFDIVSIVELGGNTFGQTGTNTVVLFLRKKTDEVKQAIQYKYRVNDFYNNWQHEKATMGGTYQDVPFIQRYCEHIEIPFETYEHLFEVTPDTMALIDDLMTYEMFKDYQTDFEKLTDIKNLRKSKRFKDLSAEEQNKMIHKKFIAYLTAIEKDKLYYFILAHRNPQKVLLVKSPSDNKEQKKFLGYEWSGSKGSEGIKYYGGDTVHDILTPMFDPKNPHNTTKINYAIQQNFNNTPLKKLPENCTYARVTDILDFSRTDFNKAFSLSPQSKIEIETKWSLVKLEDAALVIAGQSPSSDFYNDEQNGLPFYQGKKDFGDTYLLPPTIWTSETTKESLKGDILMSVRAPVGDVNVNPFDKICIGRGLAAIRSNEIALQKYIYHFINLNKELFRGHQGTTFESISSNDLRNKKIPLPPLNIQQQIVKECEAIEEKVIAAQESIEIGKREIEEKVKAINGNFVKLIDCTTKIGSGATPRGGEYAYQESGITLIRSQNVYDGQFEIKGLAFINDEQAKKLDNVTVEEEDVLFNITGASIARCCVVEKEFLPARVNQHVAILRPNKNIIDSKFLQSILVSSQYKAQLLEIGKSSSTREAITKNQLENFKIPVPPITEQKALIVEIEAIEKRIAEAQGVINGAAEAKEKAMNKYL